MDDTTKAIASLAKKPSDVTRQGTQKLKFVPTLPARRKKEEVKQDTSQPSVQPSDKGNGRGRGRGRGRGGEAKGPAYRPPPAEMTASGPFAMGPALASNSARRTAPRSNFTPIVPQGPTKGSVNLSSSLAPILKKDKQRENPLVDPVQIQKNESDDEVYSEPDEGVEIVDMENVRQLDWMAPETLQRDRKKQRRVKTEVDEPLLQENVDRSNALNLSESEEEDLVDLVKDFAMQAAVAQEGIQQEQLYFFQFPEPFPTFVSTPDPSEVTNKDTPEPGPSTLKRKASFLASVKPGPTTSATQEDPEAQKEMSKVDGVIGHMEVYRSGAVKMRLGNGIVLNVSEATQPSFFQQAVYLDMENRKLHVLGEVNKRFMVSPDLDALLSSMELAEHSNTIFDDASLIKMDTV